MENYQVIVTPDAENDLVELRDYISDVLLVPETARSYIRTLREAIGKLSYLAPSFAPIEDEPWHKKGIRKTTAKNFIIYYRLDEETKRVYILNVIYAKRDQLRMLKRMKTEVPLNQYASSPEDVEAKLDEADATAKENPIRLSEDEIFPNGKHS